MIEGELPYLATCLYPLPNEPLEGESWVLSTIVSPAPDTQSYPLGQQIPIYKGRYHPVNLHSHHSALSPTRARWQEGKQARASFST